MTDESNVKEINLVVDASQISWGDFLAISGVTDEELEPAEMVRIVNSMIVNKDEINKLPFLQVFDALKSALEQEFTQISNPKN